MQNYKINGFLETNPFDNRLFCFANCQKPTGNKNEKYYNCFIDTGVIYTIITEKIIKELNLNCTNQSTQTYALNIKIDNILFEYVECKKWEFELKNGRIAPPQPNLDILLGINAISKKKLIIYPCDKNNCGQFEFLDE